MRGDKGYRVKKEIVHCRSIAQFYLESFLSRFGGFGFIIYAPDDFKYPPNKLEFKFNMRVIAK
jgi:hypothetical protein